MYLLFFLGFSRTLSCSDNGCDGRRLVVRGEQDSGKTCSVSCVAVDDALNLLHLTASLPKTQTEREEQVKHSREVQITDSS